MDLRTLLSRSFVFKVIRCAGWIAILLLGLLIFTCQSVQAQSSPLHIEIASPGEGETFYAGPSSLLYSMWVRGYLSTEQADLDLQQVDIKIEIWQGEQLLDQIYTHSDRDGNFSYPLEVNPDGSTKEFMPTKQPFCENCHFASAYVLPSGQVRLRLVASTPSGVTASSDRKIIVDQSSMTSLKVRVVLADDPQKGVADIPVSASTRLYRWRGRSFLGRSDTQGLAVIPLERLSSAPTHYVARVDPVVVDGVRYASTGSVETLLEPDSGEPPQLTLQLTAEYGKIDVQVSNVQAQPIDGLPLKLVHLPDGNIIQSQVAKNGAYEFKDLPIQNYMLIAGGKDTPGREWAFNYLSVDLAENYQSKVNLEVLPQEAGLKGTVGDEEEFPLPFAWVQAVKNGLVHTVDPASGSFHLNELQVERDTLLLSAPGYYSQAVLESTEERPLNYKLKLRPDTRSLPWGQGTLLVPSESVIDNETSSLALKRGWLFGSGTGPLPVVLDVANLQIQVADGRFAIEYLPGQSAWMFLFGGNASLNQIDTGRTIHMHGGQMLRFDVDAPLLPAPYDSQVLAALRDLDRQSPLLMWELSLTARLRDMLARLGIRTAQVITYLTYVSILLILLIVPFVYVLYKRRQKLLQNKQSTSKVQEVK